MTGLRSARPPTVQQYVLESLRAAITTGELAPGAPIRQDTVAERLGVSRVPLREALKILEGEGQVVYLPRRGYIVAELSLEDLVEVYRIRDLLESEAARAAVGRLTDADLERVAEAQRDVEQAATRGDLLAMTEANRRFHFAILGGCGMPRLLRIIRNLWDSTDAYRSVYYNTTANRARVEREHRAILAAVRRRDADDLVRLLAVHRDHAVAALREIIAPPDGTARRAPSRPE
ncbi:GntR family transcriptional regulator [Gandjariella thermophila]|uniref:GntR family transcriptional regulator n=1 Tax=Gandjariella thermophila TaxID=1931992 RepID=A0A4D4J2B5_9PSEU|nr:GntR family transcriptional regulator [Gandjariella thermophila]GDY29554.1 GntR family transcriptional regulator [Gandjariella thermophila]